MTKSLILEEVTQALGLMNDATAYPRSIFYETATDGGFETEYAPVDRELIRLLYHPRMSAGLDAEAAEARLIEILEAE